MASNRLQLNAYKTEVLCCATRQRWHQLPTTAVSIVPASHVRDLEIYVDVDLVMWTHVKRTVSYCLAASRQVRQIRRSVPLASFKSLIVALVLIDPIGVWERRVGRPCSLLYLSRRLQSVLNAAAWLLRPSDHITDALASIHWLRVPERIHGSTRSPCCHTKSVIGVRQAAWDRSFASLIFLAAGIYVRQPPIVWRYRPSGCPL